MKAIILGSTGAVGKALVTELTASGIYDEVRTITRRQYDFKNNSPQLVQKVINFDELDSHKDVFQGANDIYVALGTTRADAGSAANFLKIDQELVVTATKATITEGIDQQVLYVSSSGASEGSYFLYPKSKGQTERRLKELGVRTIIFRPGLLGLKENRETARRGESIARVVAVGLRGIGLRSATSTVEEVAKAMLVVAKDKSTPTGTVISNADILTLSSK